MDDLVTWLRAQLDEDERVALVVPENARVWTLDGGTIHAGHPTDEVVDWVHYDGAWEHIARHDPARVLAEVDAKRRILDEHAPEKHPTGMRCSVCAEGPYYDATWYDAPCPTVRLIALPYAGRPGYRDEWKP